MSELSKATGSFKFSGHDVALVGGEVANYPLPKLSLGNVDIYLKSDTGKATIEKFAISGGDVEANGEGEITLDNRLGASHEKVRLEFKPSEGWLANKNNDTFKMGLSLAGHPDSKGFYTVNLEGMLGNPTPKMK
jgi:type II secretion system protein N